MKGIEQRPALYDAGMRLLDGLGLSRWRRALVAHCPGRPAPRRSLEVGCGTGRTLVLQPVQGLLFALDPEFALLKVARRRAPHAMLVQARAEFLPFRDGAMDQIVSSLVFCSVSDPEAGLREVRRTLHPQGYLRMLEHVRPTGRVARWLADRIQPAWTAVTGGCHPDRDTETLVEKSGFRILPETRAVRGNLRRFDAVRTDPEDAVTQGTTLTEMGVVSPSE